MSTKKEIKETMNFLEVVHAINLDGSRIFRRPQWNKNVCIKHFNGNSKSLTYIGYINIFDISLYSNIKYTPTIEDCLADDWYEEKFVKYITFFEMIKEAKENIENKYRRRSWHNERDSINYESMIFISWSMDNIEAGDWHRDDS